MRKECFVDGSPHENRCVISVVPGASHPINVCIYASGMQCTRNGEKAEKAIIAAGRAVKNATALNSIQYLQTKVFLA
jgi:hypothetical protein